MSKVLLSIDGVIVLSLVVTVIVFTTPFVEGSTVFSLTVNVIVLVSILIVAVLLH